MRKQVIVITGCSSGLGKAICKHLNRERYYVVATARNLQALDDVQADMKIQLNVCDIEEINDTIRTIIERVGCIDILINNAGYSVRSAIEEIDIEKMKAMYDVNVFGVVHMIQAVLPIMRKQESGKIINIGSISGRMTGIVNGGYCSTKYAIEAITEATRYEVADMGIQVAVMEPGAIDTNFFNTLSKLSDTNMSNENSPYINLYKRDLAYRKKQKRASVDATAINIIHNMEMKKLKVRYTISLSWIYRLFTHLPDRLKEKAILKFN